MPTFIAQPAIMITVMTGLYVSGTPITAVVAMMAAAAIWWTTTLSQLLLVNRKLAGRIEKGPRRYDVRHWLRTSLPIFLVDSFFFLLTSIDIILLQLFVRPEGVAVYYAATKTLALVAFIYFAFRPRLRTASANITSRVTKTGSMLSCPTPPGGRSGHRWQ